ncbi:MAG: hypothetical protein ABW048_04170, partial [Sphingobium sp.]
LRAGRGGGARRRLTAAAPAPLVAPPLLFRGHARIGRLAIVANRRSSALCGTYFLLSLPR